MATQLPNTMLALRLHPESTLHYESAPVPTPSQDQILIRVHSTALTRSELLWSKTLRRRLPIPGHDLSGTVLSSTTSKFKPGDQVFGLLAFNRDGAAAEYALALEEELALKPGNLTQEEAAAVPLSALTAWQALHEHANLKAGMRVLVTGAAGGVGVMGTQIAKAAGAYVIGTCSSPNSPLVRSLGADMVIAYTDDGFSNWISQAIAANRGENGVDFVLDCVGGSTLRQCFGAVKPGGKVISIAQPIDEDWAEVKARRDDDVEADFFVVRPDGVMLDGIREFVEKGKVKPVVERVFALREGREAFEVLERGHVRGKLVLKVGL